MNISGKGTQVAKYVFVMLGSHCDLHASEMNIDLLFKHEQSVFLGFIIIKPNQN